MNQIFDRFGNLIRSFLQDEKIDYSGRKPAYGTDSDFHDAWEELEEFMKIGMGPSSSFNSATTDTGKKNRSVPDELRKDYETLQVEFGAPFSEVKSAYKKLMLTYHPDHHSHDQKIATEMTQRINLAFTRIKRWEETGGSGDKSD